MNYSVVRHDLEALEAPWRELLSRSCGRLVFNTPTWLRVWWREFGGGRELTLLAVSQGEQLLGVAPLMRQGRRLSLAGDSNVCDYKDIVVACDGREKVYAAILDSLANEEWDELELWGLPRWSPTLELLPDLARSRGYQVRVEDEAVCPRLQLPATWDDYLAGLSKKDRHELRRKLRRLQEGSSSLRFYALRTPDEVAAGMDDFLRLHVQSRQDKALFMSEPMARFFRQMAVALAQEDAVRLYFLEVDGAKAAAVLCFCSGRELLLYNSGYHPDFARLSVGIVSKALCVQEAIAEGWQWLDFLRGTERYKYDLGAQDWPVYRCIIRR